MTAARAKEFDLLNTPLEGTNLTEAGAGTGKTYAIAGLFVRLIIEKRFRVDQILVVTFTEAATQELKARIRSRLGQAVEAFTQGRVQDPFLDEMVKGFGRSKRTLRLLQDAIRNFDEAAIFTIHGFCRRMLHDNAFESGSLLDIELVTDQEEFKREVVDDFWREHFYNASPLFIHYCLKKKATPEGLLSLLGNKVEQPCLKIIPRIQIPDSSVEECEFQDASKQVCLSWPSARAQIEDILMNDDCLNRNRYRKTSVSGWIRCMDDYVRSGGGNPILFDDFKKFASSELKEAVKKDCPFPAHPFFGLCERLKQGQEALVKVFEDRLLGLKVELFSYVKAGLEKRKAEKNIQFFDDLLLRLYRALDDKGGEALAQAIRSKFKAALIDEFQDTDPVQYAVFNKVFGDKKGILFLIGDPKQAIYSFRSADLFTYMQAAEAIETKYTLGENWRSEPGLIAAINTIFSNAHRPFVYDKIPFQPAIPATLKDREVLTIDGRPESPFRLWLVDAEKTEDSGKPVGKTKARELIIRAVAAEIGRLLARAVRNEILLGERPLREEDIAVLVRTNIEARRVQAALSGLNIPSVLHSSGNLFDSREALEMERVLAGIALPNNEKVLKPALATDMLGMKGEDLDNLMKDETRWEDWPVRFKSYREMWEKGGFIRMFRSFLFDENMLPRLMALRDGERRATNVLHLAEVLHQSSVERKLGVDGLLKWLSEQRDPTAPRLDEHQLRLESDENAVNIVTIHKSKGLEYPIVFCPFVWGGSRIRDAAAPFTFHDEADNMKQTLDLGSARMHEHRVLAEKEQLAENMRLLYVALTRARNRCYLVWGRFNEAETSAPAYLFHQPGSRHGDVLEAIEDRFLGLSDQEVLADLKKVAAKGRGAIELAEMPEGPARGYLPPTGRKASLSCRKFTGNIDRSWRISSFSALASSLQHATELADRDALYQAGYNAQRAVEETPEEGAYGIFSFPRGAKAGTLLHDILEHLDFELGDASSFQGLVADKLAEHGFDPEWRETVCNMIQKVVSVPLDPGREDFALSRVRNKERLNELQFYFPLKSISPEELQGLFAGYGRAGAAGTGFPQRIERLEFAPVRGFMKGFIDMVFQFEDRFYLVDWKSNFLGSNVEAYGPERLAAAMEKEFYILQYHIYVLALDQYLRLRLPGYNYQSHFGGVFYLFLRGVDPGRGPEFGIYRDRPSPALMSELARTLIDHQGEGRGD